MLMCNCRGNQFPLKVNFSRCNLDCKIYKFFDDIVRLEGIMFGETNAYPRSSFARKALLSPPSLRLHVNYLLAKSVIDLGTY